MANFRKVSDTMGEVCVPADVHYGAQTQRAVDNFHISGMRFPRQFIRSLALVKSAAAEDKPDNINGISTNRERCRMLVESSLMSVTALVPVIGYQKSAEIARESWQTGKTIREIAGEKHLVPDSVLDSVLDVTSMAGEVLARDENVATDELRWGNRHYQKQSHQSVRLDRWRDDGGHE